MRALQLATIIYALSANADENFATKVQQRIALAEREHLRQFNNDGSVIITCSDNSLNFYDINTGQKKNSMLLEKEHRCLSVSRDAKLLATKQVIINDPMAKYGHDTIFSFWDITGDNPKLLQKVKTKDGGTGQFSQNNKWFAIYGTDSFALIWDVINGRLVKKIDQHQGRLTTVAFGLDDKLFASADFNTVQLWETDKWKRLRIFPDLSDIALFSPDGKYLVSYTYINDQTVFNLWDIKKNNWYWLKPAADFSQSHSVAFNISSKLVAFSGKEKTYLYSVDTGKLLQEFPSTASTIAFSPDGKHLALSTYEGKSGIKRNVIYLYTSSNGTAVFE